MLLCILIYISLKSHHEISIKLVKITKIMVRKYLKELKFHVLMYFDCISLKSCQEILIRLFKITKIDFFLLYTITIMIILADFSIILSQRLKKVNKYLHTSLIASFGVLDRQLVSSNTTQDKKVKQNTFVLHSD